MCGLIYGHSLNGNAVNQYVLQQFNKQRNRGIEGFGLFDGQEMNMVHEAQEKDIKKWLQRYPSNMLMFHHRNPTSTINVKKACHPFSTKDYFGDTQYVLIHNGYIWNADDLFFDHQELGIEYQSLLPDLTFNDSEALLWDFALYMEGKQAGIEARGAIAFICMKIVKGKITNLYFDRNTNPLYMKRKKDRLYLASEGKGTLVPSGQLHNYDYETGQITTTTLELKNYVSNSGFKGTPSCSTFDKEEDDYNAAWLKNWYAMEEAREEREAAPLALPAGEWLGDSLNKKFNIKPITKPRKVIEYVEKKGGGMEPVERTELVQEQLPIVTATSVENLILKYLIKHKGVFEGAYWDLEKDYLRIKPNENGKRALFEGALELITNDPEYDNEYSVSSIWRALWTQKQSLTT